MTSSKPQRTFAVNDNTHPHIPELCVRKNGVKDPYLTNTQDEKSL